jgi:hypothetical protein
MISAVMDVNKPVGAMGELGHLSSTLFDDFINVSKDAASFRDQKKDEESQQAKRNSARALFAYIEGTVYAMKQAAYEIEQAPRVKMFTNAEATLLREEEYGLGDKGKVSIRSARLRTEPNLCFAFDAFARVFECDYALRLEGEDAAAFRRAIKIRDRLTHPKRTSELLVSETEFGDLFHVAQWFQDACNGLINAVDKKLEARKRSAD